MIEVHGFGLVALGSIAVKWLAQLWLERLNRANVLAHADSVPAPFRSYVDDAVYTKTVQYTLAKSRLQRFELTYDNLLLVLVLFSGILPWVFSGFSQTLGTSVWAMAAFLFLIGILLSLAALPLDWYVQFRLEERFGFNRTTQKLWWTDRLKGLLLALLIGYPLLLLILKLFERTGSLWWFWAWAALLAFQLIMSVVAPVLILPLFNKFSPLPPGSLRERLLKLAERTDFRAASIQVMDGSKRSRHSNAFFTGFGQFRKIVLFDTLVQQLAEPELEAVLAHEIGHYKKKHIPKMLTGSALASLAGFGILSLLSGAKWFYGAFGFEPGNVAVLLLLFGLLSGTATFWLSPLVHWWSRRYEYQADSFASRVMRGPQELIDALRKLNKENLGNLTPHFLYSGFYYSHPTLLEREQALTSSAGGSGEFREASG